MTISHEYHYIPTKKGIGSIEQLIYASTLTPERNLIIFREMCKAVARIHARKICHRDLKPDNFFLFSGDQIRLGDFGTAKFFDGSMPDIRSVYALPVGHTQYVAPEIICQIGIADDCTYGSDIFSLGAILFEMFTQEVLTNHLYGKQIIADLLTLRQITSTMSVRDRLDVYMSTIDSIKSSSVVPDIFSFNQFVPKSISYLLNSIYKNMIEFNFCKRLQNFSAIYRKIDICILILRNEIKYQKRLKQNKLFRASKMNKTVKS
jgi:serine/threonine protein kinase